MRCVDLAQTWSQLREWLDHQGVLVLPRLTANGPLVQLDADADQTRAASVADLARVTDRLRALVERFEVRAVYVHQIGGEPVPVPGGDREVRGEPSIVTVRVVAGGVVHELTLFAAWYAELLDRTVGIDAHLP
jgi:tagatose-1,6-bisphosphate aldolase non-catalytic subunit AgaZ/GatZ